MTGRAHRDPVVELRVLNGHGVEQQRRAVHGDGRELEPRTLVEIDQQGLERDVLGVENVDGSTNAAGTLDRQSVEPDDVDELVADARDVEGIYDVAIGKQRQFIVDDSTSTAIDGARLRRRRARGAERESDERDRCEIPRVTEQTTNHE